MLILMRFFYFVSNKICLNYMYKSTTHIFELLFTCSLSIDLCVNFVLYNLYPRGSTMFWSSNTRLKLFNRLPIYNMHVNCHD